MADGDRTERPPPPDAEKMRRDPEDWDLLHDAVSRLGEAVAAQRKAEVERDALRSVISPPRGDRRSRADLALVLGVVGLFAAGTVATYVELVGINRELGGMLVKHEDFDRRLTVLEEGQDAIEHGIVRLGSQVLSRLDAIDARLNALDQTIKGIQERAGLEQ